MIRIVQISNVGRSCRDATTGQEGHNALETFECPFEFLKGTDSEILTNFESFTEIFVYYGKFRDTPNRYK